MKVSTKSTIYHGFHQLHFMCRGALIPSLLLPQTKTMQKKKIDLFLDERSDLKFILHGGSHRCSDLTNTPGTVDPYLCYFSKVRLAINLVMSRGRQSLRSPKDAREHMLKTLLLSLYCRGSGSPKDARVLK